MRWPFRRKAERTTGAVAHAEPGKSSESTVAGGVVAPPARQWAALPVIPVTIARAAPLVAGPAPVLPPLRPGSRGTVPAEHTTGSVTGIARPVVRAPEPVAEPVPLPAPVAPPVRRPVRPAPVEAPALVDAVDEYVGEPREAAEPYRAPSWLRFATVAPGVPMLPGLPETVDEPPAPPVPEPAPRPELPPRMAEGVAPAEQAAPPMRKRRPSLGQSRRLGLGAPISKPAEPALVHPDEPPGTAAGTTAAPQEPPPPPAAPARVAPGPEPATTAAQPFATPPADAPAPAELIHPEPAPPADEPPADDGPSTGAPTGGGAPPAGPPAPPTPVPAPPAPSPAPGPRPTVSASYRATAELRPAPRRPQPRAKVVAKVVETVPAALAGEIRTRQGIDVATVPVHRGPEVDAAARSRGARAFAAGGAVFLPDAAGPVDAPRTRGLLAHELVHAAQQRTLGPHLPTASSPLGMQLEAEAVAAEHFYGGEPGADAPPPLIHAPAPAVPSAAVVPDMTAPAQLAGRTPAAAPPQPPHTPLDQETRAEVGRIATESAKHVVMEWTNPALQPKNAQPGTQQPGVHSPGAAKTPGGGASLAAAGPAPRVPATTFDREARRQALIDIRLAGLNAERYGDQLTQLDDAQLMQIEHELDAEEASVTGVSPAGEQEQRYEKNSAGAWMHAVTGMNAHYGLGLTGWKEPVGSEKSWWGGKTEDDRPKTDRVLDQLGLSSKEAETQFDTSTWFAPKADEQAKLDDKPAHDHWKYGKENPDQAPVDTSRLDLDELANRLYDRVRSKLRLELLVDRERSGLLTDFR